MFANIDPAIQTPADYIAKLEEPRQSQIKQIHEFIQKTVPDMKPYIQSGMIGYGQYHYKYASGREGDFCQVALASHKNYISIYVVCMVGDKYLAEQNKDKLPNASIGKSCIRYKKFDDLVADMQELAILLRQAAKLNHKV